VPRFGQRHGELHADPAIAADDDVIFEFSISVCMRSSPSRRRNWNSVKTCTSAPVSTIMPVQPSTIVKVVQIRRNVVSIGRTSPYPTEKMVSSTM
jgi:hypothetical protein